MKVGYVRLSKTDDDQILHLQVNALRRTNVDPANIYYDRPLKKKDSRPGLDECLNTLGPGDTLVIWKLDRLGRNLSHLIKIAHELNKRNIELNVLVTQHGEIDTTTSGGKWVFSVFEALFEFERDLSHERTVNTLKSARGKGCKGGRKFQLTKDQVRLAQISMKREDTNVSELCRSLGVSRQTLYRYVSPDGDLRGYGKQVLGI